MGPTAVSTRSLGSLRRSAAGSLRRAGLAFVALLLTGAASRGAPNQADDTERMRKAQQALEKTVALYDRVYAKFSSEAIAASGAVTKMEFEWWQDGDNIRATRKAVNPPGQEPAIWNDEHALREGILTTVTEVEFWRKNVHAPGGRESATIQSGGRKKLIGVSLWSATLLSGFDGPPVTLWKEFWALKTYEHQPAAALRGFDGPGIESRRKQDPPHTLVVYLDPTHDYLPRKKLAYNYPGRFDPNKRHAELEVVEYFTRADGLPAAFPKKIRARFYGDGGVSRPPDSEVTYTISSVRVPDSMPAATFRIKIPEGYLVLDFVKGKKYTMGPDGEPVPGTLRDLPPEEGR
jgi:hypothetical protein